MTARKAARLRMPLDGTDAQALEGALQQVEREAQAYADALIEIAVRTGPRVGTPFLADWDPVECEDEDPEAANYCTAARALGLL